MPPKAEESVETKKKTKDFNLDKKPKAKKEKKVYTLDDKKKLLEGYRAYNDKKMWFKLPVGTHVRLIKDDKTFVRGGFIVSTYEKDGVMYMILESSKYNKQSRWYRTFRVKLNDTKVIFAKMDTLKLILEKNHREDPKVIIEENISKKMEQERDESHKKMTVLIKHLRNFGDRMEEQKTYIETLEKRLSKLESATDKVIKYLKEQNNPSK